MTTPSASASPQARELISGTIDIAAEPGRVWAIVSDLKAMGERSPQCLRMWVRGGALRVGSRTVNLNRRGLLVWPTTSTITALDPERTLEFKVTENGARWRYDLEPLPDGGTRVTESRLVSRGVTALSLKLQRWFLGGVGPFEDELERGIATTLQRLKELAESR